MTEPVLIAAASAALAYVAFILFLLAWGRTEDARAWAGFVPDCVVLFKRLLADGRVSRGRKLLVAALLGYLVMPIDLVPDFIPVAGQLDDALIAALVLRAVLRGAEPGIVRKHWPGPAASLGLMLWLGPTGGRPSGPSR